MLARTALACTIPARGGNKEPFRSAPEECEQDVEIGVVSWDFSLGCVDIDKPASLNQVSAKYIRRNGSAGHVTFQMHVQY